MLAYLDVRSNQLGDRGAASLAGALGACEQLKHILVAQNKISAEAGRRLALQVRQRGGAPKRQRILTPVLHASARV
eukprot:2334992-Rhodomonas_salina.1